MTDRLSTSYQVVLRRLEAHLQSMRDEALAGKLESFSVLAESARELESIVSNAARLVDYPLEELTHRDPRMETALLGVIDAWQCPAPVRKSHEAYLRQLKGSGSEATIRSLDKATPEAYRLLVALLAMSRAIANILLTRVAPTAGRTRAPSGGARSIDTDAKSPETAQPSESSEEAASKSPAPYSVRQIAVSSAVRSLDVAQSTRSEPVTSEFPPATEGDGPAQRMAATPLELVEAEGRSNVSEDRRVSAAEKAASAPALVPAVKSHDVRAAAVPVQEVGIATRPAAVSDSLYGRSSEQVGSDAKSRRAIDGEIFLHTAVAENRKKMSADDPDRLTVYQLRELIEIVLGSIHVDNTTQIIAPAFKRPIVLNPDLHATFRELLPDLVHLPWGKRFLGGSLVADEDLTLGKIRALVQGPLGSIKVEGGRPINQKNLSALFPAVQTMDAEEVQSSAYNLAARQLANRFRNKKPVSDGFPEGYEDSLREGYTLSLFGPAGSGKTTAVKKIWARAYDNDHDQIFYVNCAMKIDIDDIKIKWREHIVFTIDAFEKVLEFASKSERIREFGLKRVLILDECTFFPQEFLPRLGVFDQVIFVGDPRQMGPDNAYAAILDFVRRAGGKNYVPTEIFRAANLELFLTWKYLAYPDHFKLAKPEAAEASAVFEIARSGCHAFEIAATFLTMAIAHSRLGRSVLIATQNDDIVSYINAAINLDFEIMIPLIKNIKIVPLSEIQGREADILIISPAEIDSVARNLPSAIKYFLVLLGRVRRGLSFVRVSGDSSVSPRYISLFLESVAAEIVSVN